MTVISVPVISARVGEMVALHGAAGAIPGQLCVRGRDPGGACGCGGAVPTAQVMVISGLTVTHADDVVAGGGPAARVAAGALSQPHR